MSLKLLVTAALSLVSSALVLAALAAGPFASAEPTAPSGPRVPVLVELFTSEGCSSCPSADTLVDEWSRTQPVPGVELVALGQHVDYWNRLGWADPYSSEDFTERQTLANEALGRDGIFTPQALVNGRVSAVGSDAGALRRALLDERSRPSAKVTVTAKAQGGKAALEAQVAELPAVSEGDTAEVWAALAESGLSTEVKRGENAGRTLRHAPVARRLARLGQLPSEGTLAGSIALEPGWKRERLQAVVFVQERKSRRILGVGRVAVSGE